MKNTSQVGFLESSVYWTSGLVEKKKKFTQQSLKHSVSFLIKNCFFAIGNLIFKQDIGAPME